MLDDYDYVKENLICGEITETKLISELKKISKGFTSDRGKINEYIESKVSVSAYSSFYFLTNLVKMPFILDLLPEKIKETLSNLDFIDFGSGPGTYAFSFLRYFPKYNGNLYLVDKSYLMLDQAKQLIENKFNNYNSINYSKRIGNYQNEVALFFGHSINEVGAKKAIEIIGEVSPKALFFIEPGTKDSFSDAKVIREYMLANDYKIVYPCLSDSPCPMANSDDWCHGVIKTVHSPQVERLSQLISLDRKSMPYISHLYIKNEEVTEDGNFAHFVQLIKETKFSFEFSVCIVKDGVNKQVTFEVMKKDFPKKEVKEIRKWSVGLRLRYKEVKEISENKIRVKLL